MRIFIGFPAKFQCGKEMAEMLILVRVLKESLKTKAKFLSLTA